MPTSAESFDLGIAAAIESVQDLQITETDKSILLGNLILEWAGTTKRTFNYKTDFPEVEPACVAHFARTFEHQDWIDGESVVQAEETTLEEGFNRRFHSIEGDLDSLGADVAQSFACIAEIRSDLSTLLDEIRTEINRINSDIHDCCHDSGGGGIVTRPPFGTFTDPRIAAFQGYATMYDQRVQLWNTSDGIVALPLIKEAQGVGVSNPGVMRAAGLAGFFADNGDEIEAFFRGQPKTKEAFVVKFGEGELADGTSVADALVTIPAGRRFSEGEELVEAVAEREAAALRTNKGVKDATAAALGVTSIEGKVADAEVGSLAVIPTDALNALNASGIKTVGGLGTAPSGEVVTLLEREGVEADAATVASWVTTAKVLTLLD